MVWKISEWIDLPAIETLDIEGDAFANVEKKKIKGKDEVLMWLCRCCEIWWIRCFKKLWLL